MINNRSNSEKFTSNLIKNENNNNNELLCNRHLGSMINSNYDNNSNIKSKFYIEVSLLGSLRGGLSLLIEHPLDSIKTQWQDKNEIKSTKEILKSIYKEKGMKGFYRGFTPNFIRVAFKNFYRWPMMLFFPSFFDKGVPQSLKNFFPSLSKILTGLAIANIEILIICPLDRLKIFFMTSTSIGVNMFKHFYVSHKENIINELFRGLGVSYWRSNVSWVSFLYLDYKLKRIFKNFRKSENLGIFDLFVISVIVGVGNLSSIMPFDFIKTQMQKEGYIQPVKQNTLSTLRHYYKNFGLRILYTGWQFKLFQYITQSLFTVYTLEFLEKKSQGFK